MTPPPPPATALAEVADSDVTLVASARLGDADALRELVQRHLPSVRAVCRQRLRSADDVADATQETVARALRSFDHLRDPSAVGAWMRSIAINVCHDVRGRRHLTVALGEAEASSVADEAPRPDERVESDEEATTVHAHLRTLGERDRRALWLRDALGVPIADVASDLGLTEGSTRVLLTRARHRLRATFAGIAAIVVGVRYGVRGWVDRSLRQPFDVTWATAASAFVVAAAVVLPLAGPIADDAGPGEVVQAPAVSTPATLAVTAPVPVVADAAPQSSNTRPADRGSTSATRPTREVTPPGAPPPAGGDTPPLLPPGVVVDDEPPDGEPASDITITVGGRTVFEADIYAGNADKRLRDALLKRRARLRTALVGGTQD